MHARGAFGRAINFVCHAPRDVHRKGRIAREQTVKVGLGDCPQLDIADGLYGDRIDTALDDCLFAKRLLWTEQVQNNGLSIRALGDFARFACLDDVHILRGLTRKADGLTGAETQGLPEGADLRLDPGTDPVAASSIIIERLAEIWARKI